MLLNFWSYKLNLLKLHFKYFTVKKFKSNLLMFLILIAYLAITILLFVNTFPDSKIALMVGIPLSLIYSIVCFFNKKVRSKMTIWWGILSLLTCLWWIYLITQ